MRRGVWFAAGAAAGVYGMVRVRRIVEIFTVDGLRDRVGAAVVGARMFREELARGTVEAEHDLRERYRLAARGLDAPSLAPRDGHSTDEATHEDEQRASRDGYASHEDNEQKEGAQ